MQIPSTLAINAEQSRAARFQLGKTQADVIQESGLPGYKLKQFETGRFVPDMPFLEGLRDYYAGKGIDFETAPKAGKETGQSQQGKKVAGPGSDMVHQVSRMCFYVDDNVSPEVVNQVLERMDKNDERISAILQAPVKGGLFSQFDEETEAKQRELFGAMAENYLAFRLLQGRNIVSVPREGVAPTTHADLLATFFAASPLASIAVPQAGQADSEGGEE